MGSHQPASKGIDLCMVFGILKHQNYKEKACAWEKERLIKGNWMVSILVGSSCHPQIRCKNY